MAVALTPTFNQAAYICKNTAIACGCGQSGQQELPLVRLQLANEDKSKSDFQALRNECLFYSITDPVLSSGTAASRGDSEVESALRQSPC